MEVRIGKKMSYLLRHGAQENGVAISSDGYVLMDDLLSYLGNKVSLDFVHQIVENNDKKRYEIKIKDGKEYIRATQGHSLTEVKTEELLTPINDPFDYVYVVHGTYKDPLPLIMKGGLNKMARNHVHMAVGFGKNGVISGMRQSCQIVIEINMPKAMYGAHKIPFFISTNQVILSEGLADGSIPPQYFRSVLDVQQNKYIHEAPFDYICVYDFECQCTEDKSSLTFNEIIEFPVVVIDVKSMQIVAEFHTYVKPVIHPQLTPFCIELTGIQQSQVDSGIKIQDALANLHQFLKSKGILETEFVFASCGDFDGNQMKRESQFKNFKVPSYLKRWINIKKVFPKGLLNQPGSVSQFDFSCPDTIKKMKPQISGMPEMLEQSGLVLEGKHHSGIDDARNIARCVIQTLKHGYKYT